MTSIKYCPVRIYVVIVFLLIFLPVAITAQPSADSLFQAARISAFEEKNNSQAIQLCLQALELEPGAIHMRVFLGRVYAWEANYSLAEVELLRVLDEHPDYFDARLALLDVYLWSKNYEQLELACETGLRKHPDHPDILYRLALAYINTGRDIIARNSLNHLLSLEPNYELATSLLNTLEEKIPDHKARLLLGHNRLAATQDGWGFLVTETTMDPWDLIGLEYEYPWVKGPIILRASAASRFGNRGNLYELESYPKITRNTYGYIGLGLSRSSIFPEWKGGLELFQALPRAFEVSLGMRYLQVPDQQISVLTSSLGKYLGTYWINVRAFITPQSVSFSRAWNMVIRRYLAKTDSYWELAGGSGGVPDESIGADEIAYLGERRFGIAYQTKLRPKTVVLIRLNFSNQEVRSGAFRGLTGLNIVLEQRL